MIKIFRDQHDYVIQNSRQSVRVKEFSFDELFQADDPVEFVAQNLSLASNSIESSGDDPAHPWRPPIGHQEV